MRFRQRSFASSGESVACFDSSSVGPISIPEALPAAMESNLDNAKPDEVTELKIAFDLDDGNLSPIDNSEVPLEMLESLIGNTLNPTDFTSSIVSTGGNFDVDTPLEVNIDEEEYSWNYVCKVLADITDREIDMGIEDSMKIATQVFEKMGHKCCTKVLSDDYDLDDGNSEDDNVLADNSQNDICELPSHIIDMTSFLISFAKYEFKVKHSTALINGINCPLADTLRFSCQVLSLVPHSNTWAKDARIIGLPTSSSVDKWFDTGRELIIVSGYASLLHIPLSSASYAHTLSEAIKKGCSCLFAKSYNLGQLGGIELDVESFNTMYLDKCFGVPENIENQHLDKFFMKYAQGLPVKELHSDKVKVRISEFIVSAKNECEVLEQAMGNQLIDARRQTKLTTVSSPAYFGCYIITKPLESLSPNINFMWRVNLQLYSSSPAGFVVYLTFPNLPFDPGIHDIPIAFAVDLNMFTNSSVLSIYDPIATLWGDWVYSEGK
ncbi:uncharacterized protein LOC107810957 [Nicotiana tabacum]|uniref:Uncharacterized protein n=6 Tax=Nicotiana TaxID=4085 RepID=A0A1S4BQV9_TOBAC|nr:PREDICTED: uncharacterized protein LOC104245317 [Nicotiana sylvestris]XP_009799212.1 PREDICTED: uncharacterized protein LOC104245317 [Nicotiana sylvestris]XP_009799213.1 PREDICTED: uncharacterized protein LOC104245317 [Nicotiana sylvestris]XP_009799214.1 PREDICTED: uncharacterized protein LOC104245317 [Nicotiana sylvestris]XP_009799215.1 PREDICTED: uncharacterized protein LOC104245317 [Nicotiana sylvestris]XP_009799216.1 PREDICTED: uncharacterized protein LOC104245317 [Nicotiana sylvestris]